ncbi:hypothetical protein EVAR_53541_1 [Eumeta japonica]|uniref:Uncharacterized protein n=1 Tax=Eumeta variegata TaxID=151549 RepID=A0A4C1Y8K9_EUMVA|nr:hypothetical protein EVAR_53541_1 [Eumeta japonica]
MAIPVIKTEFDDENAVSMETPKVQLMPQGHLPYIGLSLKKENDCIVETENNKMDEITIKQELDIGPTVLQLKTMSWPIPPAQVSSHVMSHFYVSVKYQFNKEPLEKLRNNVI